MVRAESALYLSDLQRLTRMRNGILSSLEVVYLDPEVDVLFLKKLVAVPERAVWCSKETSGTIRCESTKGARAEKHSHDRNEGM